MVVGLVNNIYEIVQEQDSIKNFLLICPRLKQAVLMGVKNQPWYIKRNDSTINPPQIRNEVWREDVKKRVVHGFKYVTKGTKLKIKFTKNGFEFYKKLNVSSKYKLLTTVRFDNMTDFETKKWFPVVNFGATRFECLFSVF